jgi:tetratricopeptide (TPR) repeat protein
MQSFEAERYSDALEDFAGASAIAPSLPDSYHFIGEIYRKFVLTDKAEQAYRRALAADPAFPPTRRSLAMLLHEAGKYEEAMAILKELEAEFPGDSFVIGELAINKLALGKAQEAVALLEKFNALAGKQPWGLAHLGRALARAGETARAEAAYREALALDANFVVAHYWLGQLLATTGRKEESARVLATYSRLRELENEEHQLRMTLLRDANDVRVLVNLARVRFLLGKRRDSLNILERARRLAPGDPELEKIYNQVKSAVDSAGSH